MLSNKNELLLMKITIWSDFQCPFCFKGETMLENVLASISLTEPVEIEYKAYQLDPDAPSEGAAVTPRHCNTMDAHRLMKYAVERVNPGKLKRLNFSLFNGNFEEHKVISDRSLLAVLAAKVGLDRDEVLAMLAGEEYVDAVRADEAEIDARADFEYIPYMLFGNGSVIQGVLKEEELRELINAAMTEGSAPTSVTREGCGPGGCSL